MKRFAMLLAGMLVAVVGYAQFEKGKWYVGASVSGLDISYSGSEEFNIGLDAKGKLKEIDIYDIKGPKTDAKAKIEWQHQPKEFVKINVSGNSYDLTEFFESREAANKEKYARQIQQGTPASDKDDELENVTDTDIFIAVNKLWTNPLVPISNFAGSAMLRNGTGIYELHMVGNYASSKEVRLKVDYVPRPNNEFLLSINSNNAGSTLKVLRIYSRT